MSAGVERWLMAALALALGLACYGVLANWTPELLQSQRIYEYLRWSAMALLGAFVWARALHWRLASALALAWLLAHVALVGLVPLLATALAALGALGLGTRLTRGMSVHPLVSMLVGCAVTVGVVGWLLPIPVHRMHAYLAGLGVLVYLQRVSIVAAIVEGTGAWQRAVEAAPRSAVLAVSALGVASIATWLPNLMLDDLAYHMALPAQLQQLGWYRMDAASQVWANAPWGSDVLHAIVQLIADRETRGSLNLLWLCSGACLLYSVCRAAGLNARWSWVGVGLYASFPLTGSLLIGMQTELLSTVILLGIAWMLLRVLDPHNGRHLWLLALLAGLLLQMKVSMVLPLALLIAWMAWQWRTAFPWRQLPVAVMLGVLVGGSSYCYSWLLTGNPVLPLYNQLFQSAYFPPIAFSDDRFGAGLSLDWMWTAVIHTEQVFEGRAMAGGWQHLVLIPLLPLAFAKSSTRLLTLVGLAYLMSMYALMHYLRYLYPALVLLIPGLLIGLAQVRQQRIGGAVAAALIFANLACFPNANWPLYEGTARSLVADHGNPYQVLLKFAPERLLVNSVAPTDRVLIIGRPYLAEHAGRAFSISWYDQALTTRIEPLTGGQTTTEAVRVFLLEFGFTHVMLAKELQVPDMEYHLLALGAERVRAESDVSLWRLPVSLIGSRDLVRERDLAYRLRHRWR